MFSLALSALSLVVGPPLRSRAGAPRYASGNEIRYASGNEIRCATADELTTDVVVVGSGLGGLSCAAMLAKYGHDVSVFEAHTIAGGCAHSFERDGYTFDSGPSLWAGCAAPSTNPLRQVLDAVGESPEWVQYDGWWMYTETGEYYAQSGDEAAFKELIASRGGGGGAVAEWEKLREFLKPMATSVFAVPPVALRGDPGALLTVLPWLKAFANPLIGLRARFLQGPWSDVLDAANVHDAFLRNWFDFLAFAFSGLPSDGTIAAAMTYMLEDFYRPGAMMDYPLGGSGAVVDALVRGVEKHGGRVALARPVEELLVEDGRCVGVRLRNGTVVRARRAVVSNAPGWNTAKLLPAETRAELARAGGDAGALDEGTPATPSFMHLHLGFRADGLSERVLESIHHIVVPSWEELTAPQQTVFVSIPSLLDPSLAPAGRHVLHAYVPATEPYEVWEGMDRRSDEYKALKAERAAPLWRAIERFIPDIRERAEVTMVGSPLTHERFLRRHRGTYGPELRAGERGFPSAYSKVDGLLLCGDSTFPGIGVPAVAGSGIAAAHAVSGVAAQRELLREMDGRGVLRPALP